MGEEANLLRVCGTENALYGFCKYIVCQCIILGASSRQSSRALWMLSRRYLLWLPGFIAAV